MPVNVHVHVYCVQLFAGTLVFYLLIYRIASNAGKIGETALKRQKGETESGKTCLIIN